MPREPDSLRVSTSPIRTVAENSSPSRMVTSASLAPDFMALATISAARSILLLVSVVIGCDWGNREENLLHRYNPAFQEQPARAKVLFWHGFAARLKPCLRKN